MTTLVPCLKFFWWKTVNSYYITNSIDKFIFKAHNQWTIWVHQQWNRSHSMLQLSHAYDMHVADIIILYWLPSPPHALHLVPVPTPFPTHFILLSRLIDRIHWNFVFCLQLDVAFLTHNFIEIQLIDWRSYENVYRGLLAVDSCLLLTSKSHDTKTRTKIQPR